MKKILFAAALAGAAILTACGDKGGGVRMGSLSEFDSLSYVLGANIGNGINFEMRYLYKFTFVSTCKIVLFPAVIKLQQADS